MNIKTNYQSGSQHGKSKFRDTKQIGFRSFPRDILKTELAVPAADTGLASNPATTQAPPLYIF